MHKTPRILHHSEFFLRFFLTIFFDNLELFPPKIPPFPTRLSTLNPSEMLRAHLICRLFTKMMVVVLTFFLNPGFILKSGLQLNQLLKHWMPVFLFQGIFRIFTSLISHASLVNAWTMKPEHFSQWHMENGGWHFTCSWLHLIQSFARRSNSY